MAKNLKAADYSEIITERFVFGKTAEEVARAKGIGVNVVYTTGTIFMALRDGDMDKIYRMCAGGAASVACVKWAAERLGVDVDLYRVRELVGGYHGKRKKRYAAAKAAETQAEAAAEETTAEEPAAAEPGKRDVPAWNERLYLAKIIEALVQQNELITQLMDNVLPHWVSDIKDSVNVNSDVIAGELKSCKEALDAIRCNTRKRGL